MSDLEKYHSGICVIRDKGERLQMELLALIARLLVERLEMRKAA